MKRIVLFIATNLAVMLVLSIILKVLGLDRYLYAQTGTSYGGLLAASAVVGFTGAIISLLMSKTMAEVVDRCARDQPAVERAGSVAARDGAQASDDAASRCPKSRSTKARRMRSPPVRSRIPRSSLCRRDCCRR
jgi:hypothetical protein